MPKAYVIADIDVTDPERYEEYKRLSTLAAQRHGGTFIVRGRDATVLEGDWQPHRVVVIEFADEESARRWYESPEYREAIEIRRETATSSLILVPGT